MKTNGVCVCLCGKSHVNTVKWWGEMRGIHGFVAPHPTENIAIFHRLLHGDLYHSAKHMYAGSGYFI